MNIFDKLVHLEHEAASFGFKWETAAQIKNQIISELEEVDVHLKDNDKHKLQEEMGDLLHAVFSLCIFCGFNPKKTLEDSIDKFERRFNVVKQLAINEGLTSLKNKSFAELMSYWEKAKNS